MSLKLALAVATAVRPHKLEVAQLTPLALFTPERPWMGLAAMLAASRDVKHRSTMLRHLKALVRSGALERRQPGNHFTVEYKITPAGKNLVKKVERLGEQFAGGQL